MIITHSDSVGMPAAPPGGGGGMRLHVAETALVSIVTAPVCASALPFELAPVVRVMLASARMLPAKDVPVPSVAELPICQ